MCFYQYVTSFLKTDFTSVSVGSILGRGFVMYVLATLILSLIFLLFDAGVLPVSQGALWFHGRSGWHENDLAGGGQRSQGQG